MFKNVVSHNKMLGIKGWDWAKTKHRESVPLEHSAEHSKMLGLMQIILTLYIGESCGLATMWQQCTTSHACPKQTLNYTNIRVSLYVYMMRPCCHVRHSVDATRSSTVTWFSETIPCLTVLQLYTANGRQPWNSAREPSTLEPSAWVI